MSDQEGVPQFRQDDVGDWVCEHGIAADVHCCNCHSGFVFDLNHECPRLAVLHLDGWGGRTQQPCMVVSETPKRYRIQAPQGGALRLPMGRQGLAKIYYPGTHLVPKHAVTFQ